MKAVVHTRYGDASVLEIQNVPTPTPGLGEVLVKVRATTVNDWDWALVSGRPLIYRLFMGLLKPKVTIAGAEVAGVVIDAGPNAERFATGDEVYGDISEAGFGGFAEYVCVKETALAKKPLGLSFELAVALPHAATLARQGLIDLGGMRQGQHVLINGAGGGVGLLGMQMARQLGAETTGVDSAEKLDTLREAGFDHVMDYRSRDFTENGQRYDLIYDTKSTRAPWRLSGSLTAGGRYVSCGGDVGRMLQLVLLGPALARFTKKQYRMLALKTNKDLDLIGELASSGTLTPVLDGIYRLEDVPACVQRFAEAKHTGKIVIRVAED